MKHDLKRRSLKMSAVGLATVAMLASTGAQSKENVAKVYGDFRLRYESVSQNNALEDADALTLRNRIGLKSKKVNGFSAVIEAEMNIELIDDFSVPPTGDRVGEFSVVADPQTAEIDQAFVAYSNDIVTAKVGRQVFTLDGHRFVGHVGWRQDRQTFDAAVVTVKPNKGITLTAAYLDKRNRIFSDDADIDSKDVILNGGFKTPVGKVVAYAYLLEVDNNTDNSLDTYGVSLKGKKKLGENTFAYAAEFATQEANDTSDTDYLMLEGAMTFGGITAKLGYESLGSDDGNRGFATPLATLHKFNGWADQFLGTPSQGLEDLYVTVAGKALGGKWAATYHDFSTDEALAGQDDIGDEINLVYTRKFGDDFSGGIKFADYNAGASAFGKVDTKKAWLWAGYKF